MRVQRLYMFWLLASLFALLGNLIGLPAAAAPFDTAEYSLPVQQETVSKNIEVPFEYDPPRSPRLIVQARINNAEPMYFLFDTGIDFGLVMFPWAAQKLKLEDTGIARTARSINGNPVAFKQLESVALKMAARSQADNFSMQFKVVLQMDEPAFATGQNGLRLAGIIGAQAIFAFTTRIDFDTKTWTVYPNGSNPSFTDSRKVWQLPMPISAPAPLVRAVTVTTADATGKTLGQFPMRIDTGNNATITAADQGKLLESLPRAVDGNIAAGTSGSEVQPGVLLPSLALAEATTSNVEVSMSSSYPHGILGLNVLERFRLTFTPSQNLLFLEERPGFKPRLFGFTGVGVKSVKKNQYVVTSVPVPPTLPGASDATNRTTADSVRTGDRLLSIDGQKVEGMLIDTLYVLLNYYEGSPARLEVQTGKNPPRVVQVERRSRYLATKTAK